MAENIKDEFARRVYKLMLNKGMNQSELARASGLERNRISAYVRGVALPTGLFLTKLASALGVKPTDLLPDSRLDEEKPTYSVLRSADGKDMRLTTDVWLPVDIGNQVVQLLTKHAKTPEL
ncbi:helix-turn-helix transcriptional regulator [Rhizobium cremeum]|uniref:helix-turn-helix domain-containing protein n=1 Tax=Rhizobium cremeum TaxID=2813827 RepID=UPI001FD16330|nr:helix-turn-helix transcriptional regulator [Rhizobium cremeum]MCJ7997485.1 helix-turn-helix transcriptional regulator [Rhizobium cremeum]MCJ8002579.1 helix-turn-helix transcriptional regulator [Rhizobium cremeum]